MVVLFLSDTVYKQTNRQTYTYTDCSMSCPCPLG